MCMQCGRPRQPGRAVLCGVCHEKRRRWIQSRHVCRCGAGPLPLRKRLCDACRAAGQRATQQKAYARMKADAVLWAKYCERQRNLYRRRAAEKREAANA